MFLSTNAAGRSRYDSVNSASAGEKLPSLNSTIAWSRCSFADAMSSADGAARGGGPVSTQSPDEHVALLGHSAITLQVSGVGGGAATESARTIVTLTIKNKLTTNAIRMSRQYSDLVLALLLRETEVPSVPVLEDNGPYFALGCER